MSDFAALDSSFLIGLAGGLPRYEETIDRLMREHFGFLVTPTTIEELTAISKEYHVEEIRDLAFQALDNIPTWGIRAYEGLTDGEGSRCNDLAEELVVLGVIRGDGPSTPEQQKLIKEAAKVVAEAAVLDCLLLVTERQLLKRVNNLTLGFALRRKDVKDVVIKSPWQINDSSSELPPP